MLWSHYSSMLIATISKLQSREKVEKSLLHFKKQVHIYLGKNKLKNTHMLKHFLRMLASITQC